MREVRFLKPDLVWQKIVAKLQILGKSLSKLVLFAYMSSEEGLVSKFSSFVSCTLQSLKEMLFVFEM